MSNTCIGPFGMTYRKSFLKQTKKKKKKSNSRKELSIICLRYTEILNSILFRSSVKTSDIVGLLKDNTAVNIEEN